MAEAEQKVDYEVVTATDILADRQTGWAFFTRMTAWAIVAIIGLLVFIKLFFG